MQQQCRQILNKQSILPVNTSQKGSWVLRDCSQQKTLVPLVLTLMWRGGGCCLVYWIWFHGRLFHGPPFLSMCVTPLVAGSEQSLPSNWKNCFALEFCKGWE